MCTYVHVRRSLLWVFCSLFCGSLFTYTRLFHEAHRFLKFKFTLIPCWISLQGNTNRFPATTKPNIMLHTCVSHVAHKNESCHKREWVMAHIYMSNVTHMNESCRTYEWVMSQTRMRHVTRMNGGTHMNASCHTYECVMSHIWMSHVTHMTESSHIYECVLSFYDVKWPWPLLLAYPKCVHKKGGLP